MSPALRWPAAILGLLGLNMAIVAVTIYYASNDPSAAVEPDYYQKAVDWDAEVRQRAASQRLGWRASVNVNGRGEVVLRLVDSGGEPVARANVEIAAFAEARAGHRQALTFVETVPGVYSAPLNITRGGLWRFEIDAKRDSEHHLSSLQLDLGSVGRHGQGRAPE